MPIHLDPKTSLYSQIKHKHNNTEIAAAATFSAFKKGLIMKTDNFLLFLRSLKYVCTVE